MGQFLAEHGSDVTGVISGFDRLRLRASLRWLYQPSFMKRYLCEARVLLKDFGGYATALSNRIRAAAHAYAAPGALPALDRAEQRGTRPHAGRARPRGAPAAPRAATRQGPASLLLFPARRVRADAPAGDQVHSLFNHMWPTLKIGNSHG